MKANYCIRFGHSLWSAISCQREWLTSCARMTCHARREFFCPKIATFSQFQVYLSITQTKQIINLLLVNHFYPVISYRRVQRGSEELLNTIRSLVMVRNQLPARVVQRRPPNGSFHRVTSTIL